MERLFEETITAFGQVDILVNSAGVAVTRDSGTHASDTTPEAFDYLISANLRTAGVAYLTRAPPSTR